LIHEWKEENECYMIDTMFRLKECFLLKLWVIKKWRNYAIFVQKYVELVYMKYVCEIPKSELLTFRVKSVYKYWIMLLTEIYHGQTKMKLKNNTASEISFSSPYFFVTVVCDVIILVCHCLGMYRWKRFHVISHNFVNRPLRMVFWK
jgi:hypothetical protein